MVPGGADVTVRGYAAIGLWQPRDGRNVGGSMRAAGVYGAAMVALIGSSRPGKLVRHPTNTMAAQRHIPVLTGETLERVRPLGCQIVAVEIAPGARSLVSFVHPHAAFYVFGPEDGSLPQDVLDAAQSVVVIPTQRCMNLAATVNVVLYDRLAKQIARMEQAA